MSDLLQQLIDQINSSNTQAGGQTEAAPTGQAGLDPFFNTPMYQLMYGTNANQVDPTQRFKFDPGYQFSQDEAAKQLQQLGAAHGLLESGPMQIALQTQLQGNADQNYQRWLTQQGGLYNNYQQQLSGLTQFGAQNSGAAETSQMGNILGPLLAQMDLTTGQGVAGGNLSTGENISSLLNNLGITQANLYSNTGAAKANALMQAFGMNAQMQNNAQASNAQQQSSQLQGLGSLFGAGMLNSGGQQQQQSGLQFMANGANGNPNPGYYYF